MDEQLEANATFESVPDALLTVDRKGSILFANQHAGRLFGYEPNELVGIKIEALIPDRYRQQHGQSRAEFSANPGIRPMGSGRELLALRSDGLEFPVEVAIGPAMEGRAIVAVIRDISEVLAIREDLGESQERLRSTLHSLNSHVALLNGQGEIIAINESWDEFSRENGAEPNAPLRVGSNYLEECRRVAEEDVDAQKAFSGIRSIVEGSQSIFTMEYPCHSPSQRRWFSLTATSVRTQEGGAVVAYTDVTEKVLARQELERALVDLANARDALKAEGKLLREDLDRERGFNEIVGGSDAMVATLEKVRQAAQTDATVLLLGETGTGKELLANALHNQSLRKKKPLVKIDCATLPAGLVESELFGHEKGAFTGAHETKVGRFELADGGTVFLDEIGELSLDLQAKLLRVLQEGEFHRVGSQLEQKTNVRIIAATNRDLKKEVREGRFRSDLYYRLNVFPIESPSLRDRREDIPLLALYFLSRFRHTVGKKIDAIEKSSVDALLAYDWPGNVRELQNIIERSAILCSGETLTVQEALGDVVVHDPKPANPLKRNLEGLERANILHALEESGWRVKGDGNAAERLGINPSTLRSRMKKLGIERS